MSSTDAPSDDSTFVACSVLTDEGEVTIGYDRHGKPCITVVDKRHAYTRRAVAYPRPEQWGALASIAVAVGSGVPRDEIGGMVQQLGVFNRTTWTAPK